ncbi:proline-rich protein [Armillaria nabsnona]|nr:proline-rich protein [Armillaria nabsnona]
MNVKEVLEEDGSVTDSSSDDDRKDQLKDDDGDNDNSDMSTQQPSKKVKTEDEDIPTITAYIEVVTPGHTLRAKPTVEHHGPFFFSLDDSQSTFLNALASAAVPKGHSTSTSANNQKKLTWKQNTPKNNSKKPLSSPDGYKALISALSKLSSKGKDMTITVFLPSLSKVQKLPSANTNLHQDDAELEEFSQEPIGSSIHEQKDLLNHQYANKINEIYSMYPIRNDPRWPLKHVYSEPGTQNCWEINRANAVVWAVAIAEKHTDKDKPPVNMHFSHDRRLKAPATTTQVSNNVDSTTAAVLPPHALPGMQPHYPYGFPPYYGYPPPMLFAPYPHVAHRAHHIAQPYGYPDDRSHTPLLHDAINSMPNSPMKMVLPCPVSLTEFCNHYFINDEDKQCLTKLKFQPGDHRVEHLGCDDWQGFAGFSKLPWDKFLSKHKYFIQNVKNEFWDV